jgi:FkbM family methyltransferase
MRRALGILRPLAARFPRLVMAYRLAKAHWRLLAEPGLTPLGFRLVGNVAMERGEFEVEETRLIGALLPDADACINVGANIGYYCCLAAKMGKPVIAFEPVAVNLRYIVKNLEANGWAGVVDVRPIALSDSRGIAKIYGDGTGASLVKGWAKGPENYPTLVPTSTLDAELGSFVAGKKCLVIVDIEGAERRMLLGASEILGMTPKPTWMVEISVSEHLPGGLPINPELVDTFQEFWSRGYEAWTTTRPYRLVTREEVREIAVSGKDTLKTHNFLFVESGRKGCWCQP